jgi:hypothetical protein
MTTNTFSARVKPTGRICSVCSHAKRNEIDAALVAGTPFADLSRAFAVSPDSLRRHKRTHVPTPAQTAALAERTAAEGEHALDLLDRAAKLLGHAENLLTESQADGDRRNALLAVRECARTIDLLGRLRGDIDTSTTINIAASPIVLNLQTVILNAVAHLPEARAAIVAALATLDSPNTPLLEHDPLA